MIPDVNSSDDEWQTVQVDGVEPNNIIIKVITNIPHFNVVCLSVVVNPEVYNKLL
mgnify:CR=1 FL=1